MRKIIVLLLAVCLSTLTLAQQSTVLSLSKCAMAFKITNPQRQLTTFEPLLTRIDNMVATFKPDSPKPSEVLSAKLAEFSKIPGIDPAGDFWVACIPIDPATAPAPVTPTPDAKGTAGKPAVPTMHVLLLIPLTDAGQFRQVVRTSNDPNFAAAQVLDHYAVINFNKADTFPVTQVNLDVPLHCTQDIVMVSNSGEAVLPAALTSGPLGRAFAPITEILATTKQNVQHGEVGLTMQGDTIMMESYSVPLAGSPLALSVANPPRTPSATELAGYLPENLAFCSASAPVMTGATPGAGRIILQILCAVSGLAVPPGEQKSLTDAVSTLSDQCSQGRALGLTVPPGNSVGDATLLAAYHVQNPNDALTGVHEFVNEVIHTRDAVLSGQLTNVIKIFPKTAADKVGAIPVDLVKVVINRGDTPAKGAPQPPITFEFRVAYINDLMLLAAGNDSRAQMVAMITRIQNHTPGYTAGKQFLALKATLPDAVQGFDAVGLAELAHAVVCILPVDAAGKKQALSILGILPAPRTPIINYAECKDGMLHDEFLLPGAQLDYVLSLFKAIATLSKHGGAQ